MAPSQLIIEELEEDDYPAAIETVQTAMESDPFHDWVYDPSKFSNRRNAASLTIRFKWLKAIGATTLVAHTRTRRCAGVAMWMGPRERIPKKLGEEGLEWVDRPDTWSEWWQGWLFYGRQVLMNLQYGRGGLNVKRYYMWKEHQAEAQKSIWTDEISPWFLNILATHPDSQGKGIGRALVEAITRIADANSVPAYLESSKAQPNITIYERLGFKLVKELPIHDGSSPEDSCTLYCMLRPPKQLHDTKSFASSSAAHTN